MKVQLSLPSSPFHNLNPVLLFQHPKEAFAEPHNFYPRITWNIKAFNYNPKSIYLPVKSKTKYLNLYLSYIVSDHIYPLQIICTLGIIEQRQNIVLVVSIPVEAGTPYLCWLKDWPIHYGCIVADVMRYQQVISSKHIATEK